MPESSNGERYESGTVVRRYHAAMYGATVQRLPKGWRNPVETIQI